MVRHEVIRSEQTQDSIKRDPPADRLYSSRAPTVPDLLCDKAEAGLAVPGVLLYEANLGPCSVNEHWGDILSTGTCATRSQSFSVQLLLAELAEHDIIEFQEKAAHQLILAPVSHNSKVRPTCMAECFQ